MTDVDTGLLSADDLEDRVKLLDKEIGKAHLNHSPEIVVIGSGPLIMAHISYRKTGDIDVFRSEPAIYSAIESVPDINMAAVAFNENLPYNYEDRLTFFYEGAFMKVLIPSPEDYLISKCWRYEQHDKFDIEGIISTWNPDLDLAWHYICDVDEIPATMSCEPQRSERYKQLVFNFRDLCKRNNHKLPYLNPYWDCIKEH
jgi:hypothetical protein